MEFNLASYRPIARQNIARQNSDDQLEWKSATQREEFPIAWDHTTNQETINRSVYKDEKTSLGMVPNPTDRAQSFRGTGVSMHIRESGA
ncbi:MAG: hypothetical protein DHS20C16_19160 [Phycisphaerae bacterium]|nr:MAG: hypothetical protein DHS20C16_19160 [Phycisphaerae bacterium]